MGQSRQRETVIEEIISQLIILTHFPCEEDSVLSKRKKQQEEMVNYFTKYFLKNSFFQVLMVALLKNAGSNLSKSIFIVVLEGFFTNQYIFLIRGLNLFLLLQKTT